MKKNNYLNPDKQRGGQPVKVLYDKIAIWFKNVYPQFETMELKHAIEELGLQEEIYVIEREEKIELRPISELLKEFQFKKHFYHIYGVCRTL